MKQFQKSVCLLGLMLSLSSFNHAFASASQNQEIAERFALADKNHDGKLTLEEAKAGMPRVARAFSKIDVQKKGYVTVSEIQAMADK